jgi:NADH:ubiquinone oxidoreductase subunit 5 (subunit L)/multisubunit Na+/H+ antiporter MnhA subunit
MGIHVIAPAFAMVITFMICLWMLRQRRRPPAWLALVVALPACLVAWLATAYFIDGPQVLGSEYWGRQFKTDVISQLLYVLFAINAAVATLFSYFIVLFSQRKYRRLIAPN